LTAPPQRTVLETLMYAALLENATFDKADFAYTVLENYYIDWNEIRVCSVHELADTLTDLPDPKAAAERVRKALQGIFENTYMFDLEDMRKKGKALAEHIKALETMSAGTPYMIQYVAQIALDGHLIPFDEASLRLMRRLGLSQVSSDGTKELCVGLDRVILKKSSLTFAAQLHHFAAGYYDVPDSPELLSQLSAIDSEAVNRSWVSPVLAASPSASPIKPMESAVPPVNIPKPEPTLPRQEPPKPSLPSKPQVPKGASKAPRVTPAAKPVKKSTETAPKKKPAVKSPMKKPVKSAVAPKKTPAKVPKKPLSKKPLLKKPLTKKPQPLSKKTPLRKPVKPSLPKKKTLVKNSPAKLVKKVPVKKIPAKKVLAKKVKGVTPSKALRKKKPK